MKSSLQVSASLLAVLGIFSQSVIATPVHLITQSSINFSPLPGNKLLRPSEIKPQRPSLIAQQSEICKKEGISTDSIAVTISAPNNETPAYSGKLKDGVNSGTRCIFFKDVSVNFGTKSSPKTWLIIHGWLNNTSSDYPDMNNLAEAVAKQKPGDRVLMLDWGEAAWNGGNTQVPKVGDTGSLGVYYAATWIRPIAEAVVDKLKSDYGLTGEEASQSLNIIGHSLGTLMASEIGAVYSGMDSKGAKEKNKSGSLINTIIALDPPSESSTKLNLGGYDVDGRTPAYIFKGKIFGASQKEFHLEAIDRPKKFSDVSSFSRAFVGAKSFAGNQDFASWAHESFQMDFGNRFDAGNEHGRVVKAFTNLISEHPFKQPNSKSSFLDLDDLAAHNDCKSQEASNFMKCDSFDGKHEGLIAVNASNIATGTIFIPSGAKNVIKVGIVKGKEYFYSVDNLGNVSNKTYNIKSLGGTPNIYINESGRNIKVKLDDSKAKITIPLQTTTINFSGVGKIISLDGNTWNIAAKQPKLVATKAPTIPTQKYQVGFAQRNAFIALGESNCGYRLAGTKRDAGVVLLDAFLSRVAIINIDNQDILLKVTNVQYGNIQGKKHPKMVEYGSEIYQVKLTNFKYFPLSQKKGNTLTKITKTLEINSVNGWKKKLQVECIADTSDIPHENYTMLQKIAGSVAKYVSARRS